MIIITTSIAKLALLCYLYRDMSIPKYHLVTYGCQMNKNDSERMETILQGMGFVFTENEEEADLIIMNTCSVRQSAEDRVFGHVRACNRLKKKNPNLIIGVTGCMAGRDRDGAIKKRLEDVDLYFPTTEMVHLPRWIAGLRPDLTNSGDLEEDYLKIKPLRQKEFQAYVSIQTGCNNFCTYCVVPFARGLEKNREVGEILKEIRDLASKGCLEVTLLGQTVNSYQAPDQENFSEMNPYTHDFAKLLWEVNQIEGIKRLHFTAPHPNHMTDEVIDAMTLPMHLNYIHLPVQSGDDEVLRSMNRRHTIEEFYEVIKKLKDKMPALAIGTDIIVGFCGETEAQFEKTVEMFKKVEFDMSYHAQYSTRSGTAAAKAFKDDVSREEKRRRWDVLQALLIETAYKKNQTYLGKTVEVLVERFEKSKAADGTLKDFCYGFSREMKLTRFESDEDLTGKLVNVKIVRADKWLLEGVS
jgi:tRNA-2-methylthio-N6-dimethylallyladenosine synthase